MKNIRPSRKSKEKFEYFSKCEDEKRMPEIKMNKDGFTALECFHSKETFGILLPCREPVLLSKALNGKEQHGLNVTHVAEDFIDRISLSVDIKNNYPEWVQKDILGRARSLCLDRLGYVPKFVETGKDFTVL